MTFKMKVTTADRTNTIARAIIDPGSTASFVHARLAQHLSQLCSKKNARVEGIAGANKRTHEVQCGSRCVVWRKMQENWGRSIHAKINTQL